MNDFDRDNLEFFLHGDAQEFEDWMNQASSDELDYAIRLIRLARAELTEQEYAVLDEVPHTFDAKEVLKRFTRV